MDKTNLVSTLGLIVSLVLSCPVLCKERVLDTQGNAASNKARDKSQEQSRLAHLENRLFFQTYSQEDNLKRLVRIEKQVFGEPLDGEFNERLLKVMAAAAPPIDPGNLPIGVGKSASRTSSASRNLERPSKTTLQPIQDQNQQDEELERKKVLILQAKDQEVSKLLADGVALWRVKRGKEAIEKFKQVVRLDPNNAEAHFSMGIIYESSGNLKEAQASYRKAFSERPNNRDYQDAVTQIEKKLVVKPKIDESEELKTLAQDASAAYKRGEYLSAVDLYKQLDERAPNQALIKYNLGTLHLLLRNPVIALAYYKEAVRLKPDQSRYVEAYRKLEVNVRKDEEERAQAETAWQGQETMPPMNRPAFETHSDKRTSKRSTGNREHTFPFIERSPSKDNMMVNYGIIAKSNRDGVRITMIGIGSRAAKAGLQKGDIIRAVDGTVVKSPQEVNTILSKKAPEAPVQMMIQREQQMGQLNL